MAVSYVPYIRIEIGDPKMRCSPRARGMDRNSQPTTARNEMFSFTCGWTAILNRTNARNEMFPHADGPRLGVTMMETILMRNSVFDH